MKQLDKVLRFSNKPEWQEPLEILREIYEQEHQEVQRIKLGCKETIVKTRGNTNIIC